MAQRKSDCRFGHACPASLSMAKSADAEKAGATQHSPKQRSQSARRSTGSLVAREKAGHEGSDLCGAFKQKQVASVSHDVQLCTRDAPGEDAAVDQRHDRVVVTGQ